MDAASIAVLRRWLSWRMTYPRESAELLRMNNPDTFAQLVHNASLGACLDSDFTGTGGAHDSLHFLFNALAHTHPN